MSWSPLPSRYSKMDMGSSRRMGPYGSSGKSKTFSSIWDQSTSRSMEDQRSRMQESDRLRMLEMERSRMLERERMRREENARMEAERSSQKALMLEQQKAIMLERERLKRMEEEAERTRLKILQGSRLNNDGRFDDGYRSSSMSFGGDDFRNSARGYQISPPRMRGNDMWDGRKLSPKRTPSSQWIGRRDEDRGRDLELETRRHRLPEKRSRLDDFFGLPAQNDLSKRPKLQDSWPLQRKGSDRLDTFERSGSDRFGGGMGGGISKDIRKPVFRSPQKSNFSSSAKQRVPASRPSPRGPGPRNTSTPLSSNRAKPVSRTPVWEATPSPQVPGLSPQLLRNLEVEARKLMQAEQLRQMPKMGREVRRNVPSKIANRPTHQDSRDFKKKVEVKRLDNGREVRRNVSSKIANRPTHQDSRDFKKKVEVKRLDNAYNKMPQGKPQKENVAKSFSGPTSSASIPTAVKKVEPKELLKPDFFTWTQPYYCLYCKIQHKSKKAYGDHLDDKKHKEQMAKKEDDAIAYMLQTSKAASVETLQSTETKKMCSTCCEDFVGTYQKHCKSDLHVLKVHNLRLTCRLCNHTFRRRYTMDRHLVSLQHSRNVACRLREEGKYVDSAENLAFPDTYDGKYLGVDFIKDVKVAHCAVCDVAWQVKDNQVLNHCKSKEHYDSFKKYGEKVLAEQRAKDEKNKFGSAKKKKEVSKTVKKVEKNVTPAKKQPATAKKQPAAVKKQPLSAKQQAENKELENALMVLETMGGCYSRRS